MKKLLVLALIAFPAHSEVFKCISIDGKTSYQSKPCVSAVIERKIEIKRRSAAEELAAEARLREFEARQAKEQALKDQIERDRREDQLRAAEIDAAQRNAAARYEQAQAQYWQAEELRRLQQVPIIINPHYR